MVLWGVRLLYRIAIIDNNRQEQNLTRGLAAEFFEQRGSSAAFVLCTDEDKLPDYYDCYLRGDVTAVRICRTAEETPAWESIPKPLTEAEFFDALGRWVQLPPDENRVSKPTRVIRRRRSGML